MRTGDGYGEMLLAALDESGGEMLEIVERDDGLIMASRFGLGYPVEAPSSGCGERLRFYG